MSSWPVSTAPSCGAAFVEGVKGTATGGMMVVGAGTAIGAAACCRCCCCWVCIFVCVRVKKRDRIKGVLSTLLGQEGVQTRACLDHGLGLLRLLLVIRRLGAIAPIGRLLLLRLLRLVIPLLLPPVGSLLRRLLAVSCLRLLLAVL